MNRVPQKAIKIEASVTSSTAELDDHDPHSYVRIILFKVLISASRRYLSATQPKKISWMSVHTLRYLLSVVYDEGCEEELRQ